MTPKDELACLQKEWTSPVYAFFDPIPAIRKINGHHVHEFTCSACGCKVKVRRYLDTLDARSTSNMRKHVKGCWGTEDVDEARMKIAGSILHDGSITAAFERKGKGKISYSHHQHTCVETRAEIVRWVCESLRPFNIVADRGFQSLMKTGRPEYYLPSPATVSRDVKLVFVHTRQWITKMLREYSRRINFTTDPWTSPNHHAFVAFSAHLEHKGALLTFPLDVVEVSKMSVTHQSGARACISTGARRFWD
ncbi:hypothetical protein EV363DRAFT_1295730 [Boletus edulis]|nr:hypothetical protein EV363DRAFT_1295730 [Boletus edulis]